MDTLNNFWKVVGFDFPKTESELELFNKLHSNYEYKANKEAINPENIIESRVFLSEKITQVDYHKRTVLAAEIVYKLCQENTMGHLKLQKLLYLVQYVTGLHLHTQFLKQSLGPYDPKLMRSIDTQFKRNKWFLFTKGEFPQYKPLEKAGGHNTWYQRYFGDQADSINRLIELFRKEKSDQVELVVTLHACWMELLKEASPVTDEQLSQKLYAWSESKKKFTSSQIRTTLEWMRKMGIYPSN